MNIQRLPAVLGMATLVVGLALSGVLAAIQLKTNQAKAEHQLNILSKRAVEAVVDRLQQYGYGLSAVRGAVLSAGVDEISRERFQDFSESRDGDLEFPGARGFGMIRRVSPGSEAAFVDAARQDGWPDFAVTRLAQHDNERFVIQYIEPVERNRQAVGLDIASEPNRRGAALASMRSGRVTLSGPITLVQATGQPLQSFLVMMPIYRPGASLKTETERERACIGWSYAPLVISEVLGSLDLSGGQLSIELEDLGEPTPKAFFQTPGATQAAARGMGVSAELEVFGRRWSARLAPTTAFFEQLHVTKPWTTASAVAGLSCVLGMLVYLVATGRVRARSMHLAQSHRAAIIDTSMDAMIVASLDGRVTDWNAAAERIFGYPAAEAIGRRMADLIVPVESAAEHELILHAIRQGISVEPFESNRLRRDGTVIPVSTSAAPLLNSNGVCIGISKIIRDTSATRRAQEALADMNRELERIVEARSQALNDTLHDFRNIVDALPSMIGYWDKSLINRFANKAYADWMGVDPAIVPGQHMKALFGDDTFALNLHHIQSVLNGEKQAFERSYPKRVGTGNRHVLVYYLPDLVNGEVRGFYALVHDITELTEKRSELATLQRHSDALLETIRQQSIVSVADRAGTVIEVNDRFCQVSGFRREELMGSSHRVIDSGRPVCDSWEPMWDLISLGHSWRGELCNRARDGSIYWVDSIISPVMDANGDIEKFISIRTDITERKRLEEDVAQAHRRVQDSERFLRDITNHLPVRISYMDRQGRFQFVNATCAAYLGRPHEDIIGKTRAELFGSAEATGSLPFYGAALEGVAQRVEHEEEVNGRLTCVDTQLVPDVTEGGVVSGHYMVSTDITERRQAERELRQTMTLLNAVLTAASQVSIIAVKPDGVISVFNKGAEQLLGYTQDEVVGRETSLRFHDATEMRARAQELSLKYGRKVPTGQVLIDPDELGQSREWTYVRKNGETLPVSLGVTPMYDEQGAVFGYLGIAYDVRSQKEQERSLREAMHSARKASQAKSQFLANMSHEIRTPMNAVIGLSYLLARTELDAQQAGFLSKIKLASKSLLSLINDILDLSKIEASELEIERSAFSLDRMLREICELMSVQSDARGIGFDLDLPVRLPAVLEGDPTRLHQILTNLLSNAIKFTESGSVQLHVTRLGGSDKTLRLRFLVRDSGIGMTADQMSRLFVPFAQADASTTRRFGGTGLGLSIVKRLVELMGGDIGVASQPGKGSEFWVELDLHLSQQVLSGAGESLVNGHTDRLAGVRVLVVDDSEINLEVAQRVLELEGAQVSLASNGQDGVDQILAAPDAFDVVLLDLQMPVLDGFDASRRIRNGLGLEQLPLIALSASTLSSEMERARQAGMNDFVSKPFDVSQLVSRIRHWVQPAGPGIDSPGGALATRAKDRGASGTCEGAPVHAWPEIAGIDTQAARQRLGGDLDLFRSMLRRLLNEFGQLGGEASAEIEAGSRDLASKLHKLKGCAGTLGATELADLAGQADATCRTGQTEPTVILLQEVVRHVTSLSAAAAPFLQVTESLVCEAASRTGHELDPEALVELLRLLRCCDLEAVQRFAGMGPALRCALGDEAFIRVRERVDNLDFDGASVALQALQPAGSDQFFQQAQLQTGTV